MYRGDVVITQGTMKITGDTVTITQNAQGEVDVFTSVGKPAYYEQKPAVDKQIVKAYGPVSYTHLTLPTICSV